MGESPDPSNPQQPQPPRHRKLESSWFKGHRRQGVGHGVILVKADRQDEAAISLDMKLGVREDVLHFDIAPAPRVA